ncbi:MAG TPA: formate dehydrogenase accessory sulfurtransferase FdhD [bacterium]|nr:formate dehydrogenase accessory sulfurtransferase FdhD [bacterium]
MAIRTNRPEAAGREREPESPRTSTTRRRVAQVRADEVRLRDDQLAVEEPLEIRLYPGVGSPYVQVAVTMRTPGHDFELAAGFLYSEGIVEDAGQIDHINYCADHSLESTQRYNIVNVFLRPGVEVDTERLRRNFYTTSSCGVCGKASIEAIRVRGVRPAAPGLEVDADVVGRLGETLRGGQAIFDKTGGLHAAGLYDERGHLLAIREDVGRHNAVDKLVGHAVLNRSTPLHRCLLMVSGRASFEIVQKAAVAEIPVVAAISAPSSLACDVARTFGMTLIGFVRSDRFSVYCGAHRIRHRGQAITGID